MRIIAGPCQHETAVSSAMIAEECKRVCEKYGFEYIFKASFDKANRSSMSGKRGVGFNETMTAFSFIKNAYGVQTLTDVHSVEQVETIGLLDFVDVIQIPAFL